MTSKLSNILAILGALSIVCGVAMLNHAAGVIAAGVFFILGALATSDVRRSGAAKKADNS